MGYPPPPALLHRYQNKWFTNWAVWNLLKIDKLSKGKKGKRRKGNS